MALSPGFSYDNTIDEHYIVEISNSASGFIRLGTKEFGDTNSTGYHGYIVNRPTIRETIDLASSTSSISNVTLTCLNNTINNISGDPKLSAEIYEGSANYINRDVTIKSRLDSSNDLLIYTGRLKSVVLNDDDTVTLDITARTPIDFLKVPKFSSKSGKFFPLLYGDINASSSSVASPDFIQYTPAKCFPLEVDSTINSHYFCLGHKSTTDVELHYPVKDFFSSDGFPVFAPLEDVDNDSENKYEGITDSNKNVFKTNLDLSRGYKIRPVQNITFSLPNNGVPQDKSFFHDNNINTATAWATGTLPQGSQTDTFTYIISDIPREEHDIQTCKLFVRWGVSNFNESPQSSLSVALRITATYQGGTSNTITKTTLTGNRANQQESAIDLLSTSTFSNADGQIPTQIRISFQVNGVPQESSESAGSVQVNAADFFLEIASKITDSDDLLNSREVTSVKKLYTGQDGLEKSYGSGVISNIAEMHRDLIHRFAGITSTPENFSSLTSARNGWNVYYYLSEQETLKDLLDKCQKEGGFIFRFKASDATPQYIYIENTENVNHTLTKDDIKGTKISVTEFDNLITQRTIKHRRNPINDEHLFEVTCTDTTNNPRTKYNVNANENILSEELDILAEKIVNDTEGNTADISTSNKNMGAGNRNDGYANYYNALQGVPKIMIETEIVNPSFYIIEVGDIVAMSHTNQIVAPFGESFNGKKFFVTSVTRTIGSLKINLMEI
tara:strand:+ start:5722 stop:7911 length:2190 start_codon:yes stop_codon:yes gene_type:complete